MVAALVLTGMGVGSYRAADDVSIEDVMKKLHKSKPSLFTKVVDGKGSKEDNDLVVSLYEALAKDKPGKGDEKDWKERTDNLLAAAKGVAAGEKGAGAKLKAAADCKGCHSLHK
jgi:hypothetical protein